MSDAYYRARDRLLAEFKRASHRLVRNTGWLYSLVVKLLRDPSALDAGALRLLRPYRAQPWIYKSIDIARLSFSADEDREIRAGVLASSAGAELASTHARIPRQHYAKAEASLSNQLAALHSAAAWYTLEHRSDFRLAAESAYVRAFAEMLNILAGRLSHSAAEAPTQVAGILADLFEAMQSSLRAYDLLAMLVLPDANNPSAPSAPDPNQRILALAYPNPPFPPSPLLEEGFAAKVRPILQIGAETIESLLELASNETSMLDSASDPVIVEADQFLHGPNAAPGIVLRLEPLSAEQRAKLEEIADSLLTRLPWDQLDRFRRAGFRSEVRELIAAVIFPPFAPTAARNSYSALSSLPAMESIPDVGLIRQCLLRGLHDPDRAGWIALCALTLLRAFCAAAYARQEQPPRSDDISLLFAIAVRLYDKLCLWEHSEDAIELRMALIEELVYAPEVAGSDNPAFLDSKNPLVERLIQDYRTHLPAAVALQFSLHRQTTLIALTDSLLGHYQSVGLGGALVRWWNEFAGSAPDLASQYPAVSDLLADLACFDRADSREAIDRLKAEVLVVPDLRGYYAGPHARRHGLYQKLYGILRCSQRDAEFFATGLREFLRLPEVSRRAIGFLAGKQFEKVETANRAVVENLLEELESQCGERDQVSSETDLVRISIWRHPA